MRAVQANGEIKTVLQEILKWSLDRSLWQRDALRRIVEQGSLTDTDVTELVRVCRAANLKDPVENIPIAVEALAAKHLPQGTTTFDSVSLVSVGNLENVNRLPASQTMPLGGNAGLTIIFGENGAGKSGYARVIKKACRARGHQPVIRSNAFSTSVSGKASAEIVYRVGGADVVAQWQDGTNTDPRLANVFVFDAASASHYLSDDNAASFTPFGLDILPTLSKVCDALAKIFRAEVAVKETALANRKTSWKDYPNTSVARLFSNLSAVTKLADVEKLSGLSEVESQRLIDLREAFKVEPLQKAKATRASKSRLELFLNKIAVATTDLSEVAFASYKKLIEEETSAYAAAQAFKQGKFDSDYLLGTGSDAWASLWKAAREYSHISAYPDQAFPVVTPEAECVLCQQSLSEVASQRLISFEKFATDVSQQISAELTKNLTSITTKINAIEGLAEELSKVDTDLVALADVQRIVISSFVATADESLRLLKLSFSSKTWSSPVPPSVSPQEILSTAALKLEERAQMEESAHDPETKKRLIAEGQELAAREWLGTVKADVSAQIADLADLEKLELCSKELSTSSITSENSRLTKQFVTEVFQTRFQKELVSLGLKTLNVELKPIAGQKGETKFGLRLVSAVNKNVADIASEGEQRCIALAAFLAELSQASHQSALVFDDPVSSLDHRHREKIAIRLATEAANRQVIVFTHDAVFLNELLSFSEGVVLNPKVLTLEWNDGAPGRYIEGLPWDSKKPRECLNELGNTQKSVAKAWNPQPNGANIQAMRNAYSLLRSTLERVVESELLCGIVRRFQSQILAGRVKELVGVTSSECNEVKRLLDRCHEITDAHAPSQTSIPTPEELLEDIAATEKLIDEIKQQKKTQTETSN